MRFCFSLCGRSTITRQIEAEEEKANDSSSNVANMALEVLPKEKSRSLRRACVFSSINKVVPDQSKEQDRKIRKLCPPPIRTQISEEEVEACSEAYRMSLLRLARVVPPTQLNGPWHVETRRHVYTYGKF